MLAQFYQQKQDYIDMDKLLKKENKDEKNKN